MKEPLKPSLPSPIEKAISQKAKSEAPLGCDTFEMNSADLLKLGYKQLKATDSVKKMDVLCIAGKEEPCLYLLLTSPSITTVNNLKIYRL